MKSSAPSPPARFKSRSAAAGALALWSASVLAQNGVAAASFGEDIAFLQKQTELIILSDSQGKAKVALAPLLQGRVLTSTANGEVGRSYGFVNRALFAAHQIQPHMNAYGGEDRFWMGPEGGQFSIFFSKGAPFDLDHWFTPAPLDTEPFQVSGRSQDRADFHQAFSLTNYSGTKFEVAVNREVRLLPARTVWRRLGTRAGDVDLVAFESINRIQNVGQAAWKPGTGLLSIWILGMFSPSPTTTIVIPVKAGPVSKLGPVVNSAYFGPVPASRLVVTENTVFFSGDGMFRSKLGISPQRCKGVLGSYDSASRTLTLVQFNFPRGVTNYVNSMWQIQEQPFAGDVANSYNDGPPAPGAKPLGPFYEMESSSPAAALAPGQSIEHTHRTIHLTGPDSELDPIARKVLGVGLKEIVEALPHPKQ
jgi:hypothetical protein